MPILFDKGLIYVKIRVLLFLKFLILSSEAIYWIFRAFSVYFSENLRFKILLFEFGWNKKFKINSWALYYWFVSVCKVWGVLVQNWSLYKIHKILTAWCLCWCMHHYASAWLFRPFWGMSCICMHHAGTMVPSKGMYMSIWPLRPCQPWIFAEKPFYFSFIT